MPSEHGAFITKDDLDTLAAKLEQASSLAGTLITLQAPPTREQIWFAQARSKEFYEWAGFLRGGPHPSSQ